MLGPHPHPLAVRDKLDRPLYVRPEHCDIAHARQPLQDGLVGMPKPVVLANRNDGVGGGYCCQELVAGRTSTAVVGHLEQVCRQVLGRVQQQLLGLGPDVACKQELGLPQLRRSTSELLLPSASVPVINCDGGCSTSSTIP